jgi:hypothetical protein
VSKAAENLGSAIQEMEAAFRAAFVHEQGDIKDKVRALVEKYQGKEAGRQAALDKLVEEGEYEGTYAYDSALTDQEGDAADDLAGLLRELGELVKATS